MDFTDDRNASHARRPHPVDDLISPRLRDRLADLDPLLNLDRLVRLISAQRASRRTDGAA